MEPEESRQVSLARISEFASLSISRRPPRGVRYFSIWTEIPLWRTDSRVVLTKFVFFGKSILFIYH